MGVKNLPTLVASNMNHHSKLHLYEMVESQFKSCKDFVTWLLDSQIVADAKVFEIIKQIKELKNKQLRAFQKLFFFSI